MLSTLLHPVATALLTAMLALNSGPPASGQLTETQRGDLDVWRTVLSNAAGDLDVQRTAARRLLDSGWDESMTVLGKALGDYQHPELVRLVCGAIRDTDAPPEALFDPLTDRLVAAPAELVPDLADAIGSYPSSNLTRLINRLHEADRPAAEKIALIAALSRFTEVEVVDELINSLEPAVDPTVRHAALAALVSVTGADHGDSMTRWQSWWRNNRVQGRDGLIRRKMRRLEREATEATARNQSLQREVAALTSDLIAAMNRNYTLTDPEQRNALLLIFLQNPRAAVRRLGLDLVEQRVLNAEPMTPEIAAVLEKMMADPVASLRPLVIKRLALVDANKASALAGPMLASADSADMEAAVLAVLAQTPSRDAISALMERFTAPERPKGTAMALLSAAQVGFVAADDLNVIAQRLQDKGAANLSAVEAELLAWCPGPTARETLAALLKLPDVAADRKTAAARGLAASPWHRDVLIANAKDPLVYPQALKAAVDAAAETGGLATLKMILGWPPLDPVRLNESITQVLAVVPPTEWVEADNLLAAHDGVELQRRVNSLTRILTLPQQPNASGAGNTAAPLPPAQRRQVCLRLAELHCRRADPEAMLTALQASPPGDDEADGEARWRTIALVALERFDAASADRGPDWVDALDLVLRQKTPDVERARRIASAIESGRATGLSDSDRSRLEDLMTKLASLASAPGGG